MSSGNLWRAAPAPHPALEIVAVVPARNEARGLMHTLSALAAQQDESGRPFDRARFEVLVLANNSDDGTAEVAHRFARERPDVALHVDEIHLSEPDAHIGTVRKLLMDAASERLSAAPGRAVMASTDGDTVVELDWLATMLHEFDAGADAVGGRILLDPRSPLDAATLRRQRCDSAYRLAMARLEDVIDPDPADRWPRHHQHFCASLALTRAAYRKVGGVPAVRYLEDEALVGALRRADLRVRHSPRVRVKTSSRHQGRVDVGLSWQLRQWAGQGAADAVMVDDVDRFAAHLSARRQLRDAWAASEAGLLRDAANAVAACFGIAPAGVECRTLAAPRFGGLWADIESFGPRGLPSHMPVRQAIDRLRELIALHAGPSAERSSTSSR